jgi:MoaA/NifB/PqqE/SkfB family radical SAM enzyme
MAFLRAASALPILRRMARGRLTFAGMDVTARCNERCPMCAVSRRAAEELSPGELGRVFARLRGAGVRVVEITGGEPFLRADLHEIVRHLDGAGLRYTLNTNGTRVEARHLPMLQDARGLLQVAVSLDSLRRERYAQLRGADLLDAALRGLEALAPLSGSVPLKVNFTLSTLNVDEVWDMLAFVRARGMFLSVFPVNQGDGLHRRTDPLFAADREGRERVAAVLRELARRRRRGEPLWEYSGFYRHAARWVIDGAPGACDAGRLYVDVRADGRVAPCLELPAIADLRDGGAIRALRGAAVVGEIARCASETPCCYTCTAHLTLAARNITAYAAETAWVLLRARARPRRRAGARA